MRLSFDGVRRTGGPVDVYDAIHVECAVKSDCHRVYTLNAKHFVELSPASLTGKILSP